MTRWVPLAALAALLLVPGSPVQLSYVDSGSMEPTLHPGDGYLLVPAGEVQSGDVITYRSARLGKRVTHRVVDVTSEGIVTKGDANEVTDQSAGHPPVRRSAVVGKAFAVGGSVVQIPGLGAAVSWLKNHWIALLGFAGIATLVLEWRRDESNVDKRPPRVRSTIGPILVGITVFAIVMVFVVATTTHPITFVAVGADTDGDSRRLTVGEPATKPVVLSGDGTPFTHRFVSGEGMRIDQMEANETRIRLTAALPPPKTHGPYRTTVRIHHYPAALPKPMLSRLHAVHPLLAATVSVGLTLVPLYILALVILDWQRPLRPPRSRLLRKVFQ